MMRSFVWRGDWYIAILFFVFVGAGCQATRTIQPGGNEAFSFALIGDMPYGVDGVDRFENLVADINREGGVEWVLHVGDIKTGASSCSDEFLKGRLSLFEQFEKPFILIPGDNEWTDCHRVSAGGYDPLERLEVFRQLFYPTAGESLGRETLEMDTQAKIAQYNTYPEHVRWEREGVFFIGLHILGSANSMAPFAGRTAAHDREAEDRMNAAITWMRESFDEARQLSSPGVFLMIHANPQFEIASSAFSPFLQALEEETIRFGRPVLLAHGDSHYFRIDKPLMSSTSKRRVENFTRVETFGAGDIHWLRIFVDPADANVFFIRQEIVIDNLVNHQVGH